MPFQGVYQTWVRSGRPISDIDQRLQLNLPTFNGHLVKGILAPMEVFHEPQGIQEV